MLTNLYLSKINILLAVALIDNINIPDITTSEKLCTSKCERRKKNVYRRWHSNRPFENYGRMFPHRISTTIYPLHKEKKSSSKLQSMKSNYILSRQKR